MSDTPNQTFKITVPITKCYKRTTADGVQKYVIEGMASNTNLDLTGERMADTAIKSMASSLATHPVVFKNEHGDEWDAEFGEVTALYATDDHQLMMEAELDPDHYRTKTLVKALEKGKSLGLSIGGLIPEGGAVKEWISDLGRTIKTYKDILLQEISVTGSPAVADTWLTNITKSVKDWKETPMPKEDTKKTDEQVEEVAEETPTDPKTPVKESTPTEGDQPEASDVDTTEKSDIEAPVAETEETPEPESAPVEPEAPAQEEDPEDVATPTDEPAPEPAKDDTSEVEETKKSLATAKEEVEQLQKSLAISKTDAEELHKSLSDKTQELETVQKSLEEKETELEKINTRKGIVFDKFHSHEADKVDPQSTQKEVQKQWAGFITGGVR